ncbi:MAG TPA: hypothetical protein VMA71_10070 [Alloacidobacterium sp.]|nr:hypothetical protein [Alloacidobacterium sp.]
MDEHRLGNAFDDQPALAREHGVVLDSLTRGFLFTACWNKDALAVLYKQGRMTVWRSKLTSVTTTTKCEGTARAEP